MVWSGPLSSKSWEGEQGSVGVGDGDLRGFCMLATSGRIEPRLSNCSGRTMGQIFVSVIYCWKTKTLQLNAEAQHGS